MQTKPKLREDEEALARLEKLEREAWVEKDELKKHYFGVSETLKHYIERRFSFKAAEQTTREMLVNLSSTGVSDESVRELFQLFEALDRVKFTDYRPERGSLEPKVMLEGARDWIKKTRRKVETPHAP